MSTPVSVPKSPATPLECRVPSHCDAWAGHRRALLEIQERLRLSLRRGDSTRRAARQAAVALGDPAAGETSAVVGLDPLDGDRELLREVEAALERMTQGSYGRCVVTGRPISPERLHLFPWVRRA